MPYPFPRPVKYKLLIKKSVAGLGLYAGETIPKDKFLIEYWGKIISKKEADRLSGRYLFQIAPDEFIEGSTRKNTARYINHSCRPNCEAVGPAGRVYIRTKKKIKAGEELTFDYGKEYFDDFIKPVGCLCAKCAKK
jgi:SET domain-containing protein